MKSRDGLPDDAAPSRPKKGLWIRVAVAVIVCIIALSALIAWKRYDIALWYLVAIGKVEEKAVVGILELAQPVIEKEVTMNVFEKVFSALMGKRNEKARQADAMIDIRVFTESGFENHWLRFKVIHAMSSLNGYKLHGFDFALDWNKGPAEEVLAEFSVDFLTRKIAGLQINQECGYFSELKSYIGEKARLN